MSLRLTGHACPVMSASRSAVIDSSPHYGGGERRLRKRGVLDGRNLRGGLRSICPSAGICE